MTYKYVATCLFGLEHLLGEEIDALGYKRINTIDGRVVFEGDEGAAARCNTWLRFAERVFILAGECRAATFEQLFEGVRSIPWENYIGERDEFPVKGHSIKSALFSIPDCQKIVKKAVVERLKSKFGTSWFAEDGIKYQIEFFILKDEAMLMIDTSGTALHKRGYRPGTLDAPLRETLAAALALHGLILAAFLAGRNCSCSGNVIHVHTLPSRISTGYHLSIQEKTSKNSTEI